VGKAALLGRVPTRRRFNILGRRNREGRRHSDSLSPLRERVGVRGISDRRFETPSAAGWQEIRAVEMPRQVAMSLAAAP
jgi:hypothetical protein